MSIPKNSLNFELLIDKFYNIKHSFKIIKLKSNVSI